MKDFQKKRLQSNRLFLYTLNNSSIEPNSRPNNIYVGSKVNLEIDGERIKTKKTFRSNSFSTDSNMTSAVLYETLPISYSHVMLFQDKSNTWKLSHGKNRLLSISPIGCSNSLFRHRYSTAGITIAVNSTKEEPAWFVPTLIRPCWLCTSSAPCHIRLRDFCWRGYL